MCVLFIAYQVVDEYPLIILANRDEFHQRPARPLAYWPDQPSILAGRDLEAGGTWLGVSRHGKIAALTNYRQGHNQKQQAPSRGDLVSHFLANDQSADDYLSALTPKAQDYNGFNLLLGDSQGLFVFNNQLNQTIKLTPGFHGLANGALNDPWPKVSQGTNQLRDYLQRAITPKPEELLLLMQNDQQAADHLLPDTGIGQAWERFLSPTFIRGEQYGTRCSSLLLFNAQQQLQFTEFSYDPAGDIIAEHNYRLTLARQ